MGKVCSWGRWRCSHERCVHGKGVFMGEVEVVMDEVCSVRGGGVLGGCGSVHGVEDWGGGRCVMEGCCI